MMADAGFSEQSGSIAPFVIVVLIAIGLGLVTYLLLQSLALVAIGHRKLQIALLLYLTALIGAFLALLIAYKNLSSR